MMLDGLTKNRVKRLTHSEGILCKKSPNRLEEGILGLKLKNQTVKLFQISELVCCFCRWKPVFLIRGYRVKGGRIYSFHWGWARRYWDHFLLGLYPICLLRYAKNLHHSSIQSRNTADSILGITFGLPSCAWPHP